MNPYAMYLPYSQTQQPAQTTQQSPQQQVPTTPYYPPVPMFFPPSPPPEQEIEMLEAYKSDLEEELRGVEARIGELKNLLEKNKESPEGGK